MHIQHTLCTNIHELWLVSTFYIKVGTVGTCNFSRIDNAVGGQWDSESRLVNIQHTLCTNIHELWLASTLQQIDNAVGQRIDNAVGQRIDSVGGQWDSESRLVNIQHTLCTNIHELWVNGNFHIKVGISQTSQTSLGLLLLSHFMLSELLPYYMDTVPILYRYCSYMRCDSWQGIGKVDVLWAWKKCLE